MKTWLRRLRGAVGMGLTWAAAGFLGGLVIELVHNVWPNPIGAAVDIWPAVLAYPGFLGGLAFSGILGIAGRRRRFDELSLPGVAGWGAAGGALVSLIPAVILALRSSAPLWEIALGLVAPFTLGGAIAAAGTLALARMGEDRDLLESGREVGDAGLTLEERRRLLDR